MRPHVLELEHADTYPAEMVEQMKALGLFGATIAQEYGGLGLSATTYAQDRRDDLGGVDVAVRHLQQAPHHGGLRAAHGTEEQKRHYLPLFATGEIRGGLALTEPDCGTDLQAIRMRAVRDGDLRHQRHQDLDLERHPRPVLRAAGEDRPRRRAAPQGHEHVPGREGPGIPGFEEAREDRLQGHRLRRAHLRGLSRSGRRRSSAGSRARACRRRSAGWSSAASTSRRAAAGSPGGADESVRYAQFRRTFGKPIAEHQAIQLKLARWRPPEAAIA